MASEDLFAEVFDISTDIGQLPENKDVLLATNKVRNQELATSSIDEQNIISLADHDKPTCAEGIFIRIVFLKDKYTLIFF